MSAPPNHVNPSKPVSLNDSIAIFWPIDKQFFPGVVTDLTHDGNVVVHYEDGDVETLDLSAEAWKFLLPSEPISPLIKPVAQSLPAAVPDPAPVPTSTTAEPPVQQTQAQVQLQPPTNDEKPVIVRRERPPKLGKDGKPTNPAPPSATNTKTNIKKRVAPASFKQPVQKKSAPGTHGAAASTPGTSNAAPTETAAKPLAATVAVAPTAPVTTGIAAVHPAPGSLSKPPVPITVTYTTGQAQLARPITSGVPLCNDTPLPEGPLALPPLQPQGVVSHPYGASTNLQDALEPLMTSFNAQLNTQATRISTIRDMLLNLSPRLSELDDRCKILRADVDNLESEVTSRAEMHKILNGAFMKQMDELSRTQVVLLERMKMDFRQFLVDEMKAVEKHLAEEIRTKSAEVFKELFRGVAESIKDTAVKNAIEDMSIPTCPSKSNVKLRGGRSSRS